jgi:tRNA dimethylallyltransferase
VPFVCFVVKIPILWLRRSRSRLFVVNQGRPRIIVVLGPTAVGKSEVALELAETLEAEIINADSQQVYRHMDIGTGKPTKEHREIVPHHLIDIVDPNEEFNAALFRTLAIEALEKIQSRGKRAIVSGGTGLYIKALTRGLFVGPAADPAVRQRLAKELAAGRGRLLYERLAQVDPNAVSRIHSSDRQRIIRALEVYELTGRPMSEWQKEHAFKEIRFDALKIGLERDRRELYELINQRCERMIQDGLIDEVQSLVAHGYSLTLKALQSVGYRHAGLFLTGSMSLEAALSLMQRDTRRLAKRQLTWFRADQEIHWFHPDRDRGKIRLLAKEF